MLFVIIMDSGLDSGHHVFIMWHSGRNAGDLHASVLIIEAGISTAKLSVRS